MFRELYFDNTLWAYTIWVLEEVQVIDKGRLNNPVLHHLLAMGAWDWDQRDGGELHQATRAMRHAMAMTSCLLSRILKGETKVSTASSIKTWLMLSLLRHFLEARLDLHNKEITKLGTSTFTTFFQIDEDLGALDQCCNCSYWSIEVVEGMQMRLMEQMAALVCRVDELDAQCGEQCLCIQELE